MKSILFLATALAALSPTLLAQTKPLKQIAKLTAKPAANHPPIAIGFSLKKAGFVTLVIEDASGNRVRNLVSETRFAAGQNTVSWDGLDDVGRDPDAAAHSIFHIPGKLVSPGTYTVRGLTRDAINLRFQSAPYNPGSPAWETKEKTSMWLGNHTSPQSALWVPESDTALSPAGQMAGGQVLVGSFVTEGGSGLAALDLEGRKRWGTGWIGGNWTAAPFLARDGGANRAPDIYAYVASAWDDEAHPGQVEIRLTGMRRDGDRTLPHYSFVPDKVEGRNDDYNAQLGGIAARDGLVVAALPKMNQLLFVDTQLHTIRGTAASPDVRGVAFDAQGRLLALSGRKLVRYSLPPAFKAGVRVSFEVATSSDGQNFQTIASGSGTPTTTTISFPRLETRFLKITQTGSKSDVYWSINALSAFDAPPALQPDSALPTPETLVSNLENPQDLTLDVAGNIEEKTLAALSVSGDSLFAAFKTNDPNLLQNAGDNLPLLFKSGGALDIQLGTTEGGQRLLVSQAKGKTTAMLYGAKVAGTPLSVRVPFTSPLRTVFFDIVENVSAQVQLVGDGKGSYELSVPLSLLNLNPKAGQSIKGDIGILRGNGFQTTQRVYWHNKATGLVSDVPSEAELLPQLWGQMQFKAPGRDT